MMRCMSCGERKLKKTTEPHWTKVAGTKFSGQVAALRCPRCSEVYLDGPALVRFELEVALELARLGSRSGEALRFMRKAIGLTARALAALLAVAPETVSRWETGQRAVDAPTFVVLGRLVGDKIVGSSETRDLLEAQRAPSKEKHVRLVLKPA